MQLRMQDSKKNAKLYYIFRIAAVLILVLIFYFGTRPANVIVERDTIKILGMYGVELRIEDIDQLELRDALPQVLARTNGMDLFGIARRGIYELDELGRTRMLSFSNGGPFILIQSANEWIVINFKEPGETEALYQEIEGAYNIK